MTIDSKLQSLKSSLLPIFIRNNSEFDKDSPDQIVDEIINFLSSDIECSLTNDPGIVTTGFTIPPFTSRGQCFYQGEREFFQTDSVLRQKCLGFFSTSSQFAYGKSNIRLSKDQTIEFYTDAFSEFLFDFFASSKFDCNFTSVSPLPAVPTIIGTLTGSIFSSPSSTGLQAKRSSLVNRLNDIMSTPLSNVNDTSISWFNFLSDIKNSIRFNASVNVDIPSIYDPATLSGTYTPINIVVKATIL